jgi:hypothetical protein
MPCLDQLSEFRVGMARLGRLMRAEYHVKGSELISPNYDEICGRVTRDDIYLKSILSAFTFPDTMIFVS